MSPYGWLIDLNKCTGCRACQVACKRWNELPAEITEATDTWTNPTDLSPQTWTYVDFMELNSDQGVNGDGFEWAFVKRQCWHCDDPACVRACPAGAITKYDEGPVVIDPAKCTGCKYCVDACPFGIPRYNPEINKVFKCHFCYDRIGNGLPPACIQACTTGALQFGELEELRTKARGMGALPKRTSVMYVLPTFRDGTQPTEAQLKLDSTPDTRPTWQLRSITHPLGVLGTAATLLGGFAYVIKHRARRVKEEEGGL